MIQVKFNKITRRYRVRAMGKNNEVLSVSESLNSRQAVLTNIAAQKAAFNSSAVVWEGIKA